MKYDLFRQGGKVYVRCSHGLIRQCVVCGDLTSHDRLMGLLCAAIDTRTELVGALSIASDWIRNTSGQPGAGSLAAHCEAAIAKVDGQ